MTRFDGAPDGVAAAIIRLALLRGTSIACAESCTGGLVSAALTDVPGASSVFQGGVVAYADQAKTTLLGVSQATLAGYGAVSPETAREMAAGARSRFAAEISVAVSGVAGPGGGTPETPLGTVCFAVDGPGGVVDATRHFPGDRDSVRRRSVEHALAMLLEALQRS